MIRNQTFLTLRKMYLTSLQQPNEIYQAQVNHVRKLLDRQKKNEIGTSSSNICQNKEDL